MALRFHWSLSSAGGETHRGAKSCAAQSGLPNLQAQVEFCRRAADCGIDSLLTAFGLHRPDPIALAAALGVLTERITFMVAVRSGVCSPTSLVQQVNTVSALTQGRICLNIVAGHTPDEQRAYGDFLSHDERYERTDEFLSICRSLWNGSAPVTFAGRYYQVENATLNTQFSGGSARGAVRPCVPPRDACGGAGRETRTVSMAAAGQARHAAASCRRARRARL
jgi:alkanesulfonate monooxygenase